ncbi:hypothetical protein F5B19DRAFT_500867 [Rostrohypoxylon terebratum]|nr:hypothetical protein F5B19DRAFT_500867 [Rostrohypoxylon terebratum]
MLEPLFPGIGRGNENRGPSILGAVVSTTSVAFIAFCLRIYARAYIARQFEIDDYVIILAMLLSISIMGITIAEVQNGSGRYAIYLEPEMVRVALKLSFISQPLSQWNIAATKISILLSLLRKELRITYKRIIHGLIVFLLAFTFARFVLMMVQCKNMAAIWDPRVKSTCLSEATMIGVKYTNSTVNVITDVLVLVLAAIILWNTRTNTQEKYWLAPVMIVGLVACVAGLMKPISMTKLEMSNDTLWTQTNLNFWNPVEINIGILAACISFLEPMIRKIQKNTARSISTTKTDAPSLRPLSSFSSDLRASRYFSSQTRTEISAQRRSLADYADAENGFLGSPNEIIMTTVIIVDSLAKDNGAKSVGGSQNDIPQQPDEFKL